jgi:hypothetical protein
VFSGPDKEALIEEYCETLNAIPCKHFNGGRGSCPFRNSCNYAHEIGGVPYEYPWADNKLLDGEWINDKP